MDKKKLTRLIAVCMACLGMGMFAFSGCKGNGGGGTADSGKHEIDDGNGDDGEGKQDEDDNGGNDDDDKGDDDGKKDEENKEPEITGPVEGGVKKLKASNEELEAAYITWEAADNAKWYNVYYSVADANTWTKLDAPLVREYKNYYRADAVGLAAGTYDMKVVPVSGEDEEASDYASTASGITVKAHTREGYAFVSGTSSGAYNEDGTLKSDAQVVYITDANKDTVELNGVTGIQNILQAQKKATAPLSVRFIGNVTSPAVPDKEFNKNPNSLQVKENGKGITLEGIGNDATANGWTIKLVNTENVEVRNLGVMNTKCSEPDGISIEKGNHIWVHNCDIFYGGAGGDSDQAKGDGALDTKLATYVTHSFNHFYDSGKSNLQGMKSESTSNYITYHHNWYDHSDSRHPRIRTCTVHIYNNYFDGNSKYGVGVTTGASAFVENNYFRSTTTMKPMMSSKQGTDLQFADKGDPNNGVFAKEDGGMIKSFGNAFVCPDGKLKLITQNDTDEVDNIDCFEAETRDQQVPSAYHTKYGNTTYSNFDTASDFYGYTPDSAEAAKTKVERYAGRIDGGDFKWEFDNEKEDGNYSVISELKAALVAYKGDLVKIDGVAVTGGTTPGGNTEGGESGGPTVTPPSVDGKQTYNPETDGAGGTYGVFTVAGGYKSKSTAVTIAEEGVSIAQSKALKLNSSGEVSFTVDKAVTLTVYINLNGITIGNQKYTGTASGNYYVITVELGEGSYTVKNGGSESQLYLLTLTPKD